MLNVHYPCYVSSQLFSLREPRATEYLGRQKKLVERTLRNLRDDLIYTGVAPLSNQQIRDLVRHCNCVSEASDTWELVTLNILEQSRHRLSANTSSCSEPSAELNFINAAIDQLKKTTNNN